MSIAEECAVIGLQAHLVDRFPELVLPSDVESVLITLVTPSLRTCLAEREEAPVDATDVLHHAVRVLRRYCAAVTRYVEVRLQSSHLLFLWVQPCNFPSLRVVSRMLTRKILSAFNLVYLELKQTPVVESENYF